MPERLSILIVEDEAIIAMSLRYQLEKAGYYICSIISSGEEAVEYVSSHQPDLILFDNRLSKEMTGIQAACEIKKSREIPVIFITGYQFEEFMEQAEAAHPLACLNKPLNFPRLKEIIEKHFH